MFDKKDIVWACLIVAMILVPLAIARPGDPGHSASAIGPGSFEPGIYTFKNTSTVIIEEPGELCFGSDCRSDWGAVISSYVNITPTKYNGSITYGSLKGYQAANAICNATFPGTHFCTTDDILNIIATKNISGFDSFPDAWVAEGPPGYAAPSNDCQGWTSDGNSFYGPFWRFSSNGGGQGYLTYCNFELALSCCK